MTALAAIREAKAHWPKRRPLSMWEGEVSCVAWEQADARGPSIHFAHANGFNAMTYRSLLDPLARDFRMYATDLRGHGHTTLAANPKGMRSWQIYRDDLLRILQELDGRPKLLVGHSLGATVSLMAALAKPNWVTGLVLVEPVILPPLTVWTAALLRAFGLTDLAFPMVKQAQRRSSIWPSRAAMFEAYRGRGAFRTWPESVVRDYIEGGSVDYIDDRQVRLACTPGWEAANYRAGPPNVWREINNLRCPVTLVLGDKRSTVPDDALELFQYYQPSVNVVRIAGASHFLPMERPDVVRAEIRAIARA